MKDPLPRDYDAWRTRSPEDEEAERERKCHHDKYLEDRADYDRDRKKDEPKE